MKSLSHSKSGLAAKGRRRRYISRSLLMAKVVLGTIYLISSRQAP